MVSVYIIPANSKKSQLILGFFTRTDLILFLSGVGLTLLLLITIKTNNVWAMILLLLPALISSLLVMPVPNYHNMLQLIKNFIQYFTQRRNYIWKGWCWRDGNENTKQ